MNVLLFATFLLSPALCSTFKDAINLNLKIEDAGHGGLPFQPLVYTSALVPSYHPTSPVQAAVDNELRVIRLQVNPQDNLHVDEKPHLVINGIPRYSLTVDENDQLDVSVEEDIPLTSAPGVHAYTNISPATYSTVTAEGHTIEMNTLNGHYDLSGGPRGPLYFLHRHKTPRFALNAQIAETSLLIVNDSHSEKHQMIEVASRMKVNTILNINRYGLADGSLDTVKSRWFHRGSTYTGGRDLIPAASWTFEKGVGMLSMGEDLSNGQFEYEIGESVDVSHVVVYEKVDGVVQAVRYAVDVEEHGLDIMPGEGMSHLPPKMYAAVLTAMSLTIEDDTKRAHFQELVQDALDRSPNPFIPELGLFITDEFSPSDFLPIVLEFGDASLLLQPGDLFKLYSITEDNTIECHRENKTFSQTLDTKLVYALTFVKTTDSAGYIGADWLHNTAVRFEKGSSMLLGNGETRAEAILALAGITHSTSNCTALTTSNTTATEIGPGLFAIVDEDTKVVQPGAVFTPGCIVSPKGQPTFDHLGVHHSLRGLYKFRVVSPETGRNMTLVYTELDAPRTHRYWFDHGSKYALLASEKIYRSKVDGESSRRTIMEILFDHFEKVHIPRSFVEPLDEQDGACDAALNEIAHSRGDKDLCRLAQTKSDISKLRDTDEYLENYVAVDLNGCLVGHGEDLECELIQHESTTEPSEFITEEGSNLKLITIHSIEEPSSKLTYFQHLFYQVRSAALDHHHSIPTLNAQTMGYYLSQHSPITLHHGNLLQDPFNPASICTNALNNTLDDTLTISDFLSITSTIPIPLQSTSAQSLDHAQALFDNHSARLAEKRHLINAATKTDDQQHEDTRDLARSHGDRPDDTLLQGTLIPGDLIESEIIILSVSIGIIVGMLGAVGYALLEEDAILITDLAVCGVVLVTIESLEYLCLLFAGIGIAGVVFGTLLFVIALAKNL